MQRGKPCSLPSCNIALHFQTPSCRGARSGRQACDGRCRYLPRTGAKEYTRLLRSSPCRSAPGQVHICMSPCTDSRYAGIVLFRKKGCSDNCSGTERNLSLQCSNPCLNNCSGPCRTEQCLPCRYLWSIAKAIQRERQPSDICRC